MSSCTRAHQSKSLFTLLMPRRWLPSSKGMKRRLFRECCPPQSFSQSLVSHSFWKYVSIYFSTHRRLRHRRHHHACHYAAENRIQNVRSRSVEFLRVKQMKTFRNARWQSRIGSTVPFWKTSHVTSRHTGRVLEFKSPPKFLSRDIKYMLCFENFKKYTNYE